MLLIVKKRLIPSCYIVLAKLKKLNSKLPFWFEKKIIGYLIYFITIHICINSLKKLF